MLKILKKIIIGILVIIFLTLMLSVWVFRIEPDMLIVRKEVLYIPNWSTDLDGLKVALIADMHIGSCFNNINKVKQIVETTNKQKPDLIFLLGDMDTNTIVKSKIDQNEIAESLGKLKANCGVISIIGNHDVRWVEIILNILKKANITILQDSFVKLKHNNTSFYVAGIKDYWHFPLNIKGTIKPIKNNDPIILLSHNPDVFPEVPERISLTLSGHTHGGIIILPFIGGLFSPSKYKQRYLKGYIVEDGKHLYVTSGIGNSSPIRFNDPPEIVILTLRSQEYTKNPIINTKKREGINKSFIPHYFKVKKKVLKAKKKLLK